MDDFVPPMGHSMASDPTSWNLEEGDEITPGLHALKKLGGGSEYEAYLSWSDELLFLVVAKCLRPHLVDEERARRVMKREADLLLSLNHPVIVRGFDAVLDGPHPHVLLRRRRPPRVFEHLHDVSRLQPPVDVESCPGSADRHHRRQFAPDRVPFQ
mgnify:CR=1 FL=1